MVASSFMVVVAVMSVVLPPTDACTYWCMNPQTGDYVCCDDGNPWYTGVNEGPAPENEAAIIDSVSSDDVDDAGSSGCRYYCNYNSQVYCCDNGEGISEYFIPQYHVPHYIGPPVVETLPPKYIVQGLPGYDSISQMNPFGLFRNSFRIVDADTEEETRDSGSFQTDIRRFVDHVINSPTLGRLAFDSLMSMIPSGSSIEPVINSPTLGRLAFDSLMNMIPSGSPEERAETSKSLDESNLDKRQTDNNVGLNPSPSSNNIFNSIPTLDDMSSLFFGNGEDDSRTGGTGQNGIIELDIPILSSVPLVNSFAISSPSGENIFSGGVPLVPSNNSFVSSNPSDTNSISNGIPLVTADNSFASSNPSEIKSASNGVPLLPVVKDTISGEVALFPADNSFASPNPSNINSASNGVPLIPVVKNSFSGGVPLVPANISFASPNSLDTNSASNGFPLIPIINLFPVSNISETFPNSIGVPLISSDNSFPDPNELRKHNISNTPTINVSQRLPHSQGVPLPFTRGQANTAFVMQHVLQQPEMANAVMHSQQSPIPPVISTKESHQENTEESEPEEEIEAPLITIAIGNSLKIKDTLEIKEELSDVSTLPIIASEDILNDVLEVKEELSDVSTLPIIASEDILNNVLEVKEELSDVSSLPIILSEDILSTDVTHTPVIPVHSDISSTLSHPSQLTQTENPSLPEMYGTLPINTTPQKLNNHVSIHYQKFPFHESLQGQQVHGSIPFSTNQHSFPSHYSHKNGYPIPSTKHYRRPNRPFVSYQTPKTYPQPSYSPNTYPKPAYNPNTYPNPTYNPNTYPKPTYDPSSIRFTPDFILTGSDTPGLPPAGLMPPSNDLQFFSHIPVSISDTLVAPPKETISVDNSEDFVTDDVLDLVMNINKATCLCLENGERRTDKSCPCSIEDLVVVFPPTPLQPYLLLPLSKSESFTEKFNFDKIEKSLGGEELITSPSEYSIQKVSPENKRITVNKEKKETYPEQKQQNFLEVLKRFHNLSNQIHKRTLADILGNSSKLPKVEINDEIEELINSDSSKSSKFMPSQT